MPLAQQKGLYRRGKTWWLRYTPLPNGPQVRVSLKTADEVVAQAEADRLMAEPAEDSTLAFKAELEVYFSDRSKRGRLAPATISVRRTALHRFAEDCGVQTTADITVRACEQWMGILSTTCQPLSVHNNLMHISAFCRWLVKKLILRANPVKALDLGKRVVISRKNFLPKERVKELIAAAPNDDLRFILFCGFHAGMRKMEITEARPDWFNLSGRGGIHIARTATYTPKDKEARTIPLTAEFRDFLRAYLPTRTGTWMLRGSETNKSPIYRIYIHPEFDAYMRAQGVRCTLHDMRRSFVSNKLIEDGRLAFKLSKWTGTDLKTLLHHYGHLLTDDADIEAGV